MSGRQHDEMMMAGFLQQVPGSWLLLLIRSLPAKDRLSVFRASKWLAAHVVQSTRELEFWIRVDESLSAEALVTRQAALESLLWNAPPDIKFKLNGSLRGIQVWPVVLCKKLASLMVWTSVKEPHNMPGIHGGLGSMSTLTQLCLYNCTSEENVQALCDVLRSGCMQHVQEFTFCSPSNSPAPSNSQQLVCMLQSCTRLTRMCTTFPSLLHNVHNYTALPTLYISSCHIPGSALTQLCRHPVLRDVELHACTLDRTREWVDCCWASVTLSNCDMKVLSSLPLPSIPRIIVSSIRACKDEQDRQAMEVVLTHHASKLVCKSWGPFPFYGVCRQTAQLTRHLQDCSTLDVHEHVQHASVLKVLWQSLPSCVNETVLWGDDDNGVIRGIDWTCFWDGMPTTVTCIKLFYCHGVPIGALAALVRAAPAHVHQLTLSAVEDGIKESWKAAALQDTAPAHLTLMPD